MLSTVAINITTLNNFPHSTSHELPPNRAPSLHSLGRCCIFRHKSLLAIAKVSRRIHSVYKANSTQLLALAAKFDIPNSSDDPGVLSAALVLGNVQCFIEKLREACHLGNGEYEKRDMNPKGPEVLRAYIKDTLSEPVPPALLEKALKIHCRVWYFCTLMERPDNYNALIRMDLTTGGIAPLPPDLPPARAWLHCVYQFFMRSTFTPEFFYTTKELRYVERGHGAWQGYQHYWRKMGLDFDLSYSKYVYSDDGQSVHRRGLEKILVQIIPYVYFDRVFNRLRLWSNDEIIRYLHEIWSSVLGEKSTESPAHDMSKINLGWQERYGPLSAYLTRSIDINNVLMDKADADILDSPFKTSYVYSWHKMTELLKISEKERGEMVFEWVKICEEVIRECYGTIIGDMFQEDCGCGTSRCKFNS